jgi:hypothetical protein
MVIIIVIVVGALFLLCPLPLLLPQLLSLLLLLIAQWDFVHIIPSIARSPVAVIVAAFEIHLLLYNKV